MQQRMPIAGLHIDQTAELIHLHSDAMMSCLSSAVLGGGFRRVRDLINAQVAQDYCSQDPVADLRAIARRRGIDGPFVGLLTAVPMHKVRSVFAETAGLGVGAVVTAGLANATCVGISPPHGQAPGTINIIVLIDGRLTRAAMVNAVITATEAKTAALAGLGLTTPEGLPATGTSTDTVTVVSTGRGARHSYAGPATVPGWLIGRCVREAL